MSPLDGKRHLKFELLELRAMLAGNVLVSVIDGDLRVEGDDQDNVLEFQQLTRSDSRAARGGMSFRITPGEGTSLNRNDPGVGMVISGVTRNVDVNMGGGADALTVMGASGRQIQNLVIDAGGGPDAVRITGFRLSHDISITAADSVDLSIDQTKAAHVFVEITTNQDDPKTPVEASASSVTIRDSRLRGSLNVASDAALDMKIHGIGVIPDVCKTPAPPAPFVPCGSVNISSGTPLSLDMTQTRASDVTLKINDIQNDSKNAKATPTSSITLRDSRLHGNLNVASEAALDMKSHGIGVIPDVCKTPAPPAPIVPCGTVSIFSGAPLALAMDQTRASDVIVKIDSIKGDSSGLEETPASSVSIRNSRLSRDANISSNAPLAVDIENTKVKGGVWIEAKGIPISDDIRSSPFANSIRLVDSVLGSLTVVGSDRSDELEFVRLHVLGKSQVETGGGEDSLAVFDTVFGGFTFLDGGDDTDSLILQGTRFRRGSNIVNWK